MSELLYDLRDYTMEKRAEQEKVAFAPPGPNPWGSPQSQEMPQSLGDLLRTKRPKINPLIKGGPSFTPPNSFNPKRKAPGGAIY